MIELLVSIVIVSIMMMMAVPSFRALLQNNRIITEVYTLRASISLARAEALARRDNVIMCPSLDGLVCTDTNDWSAGYMSYVDDITLGERDIIQWQAKPSNVTILFDNKTVRYNGLGTALGYQGTFTFCDDRGSEYGRALILNPVGSLRGSVDTDDDGIVNDLNNTNISCE